MIEESELPKLSIERANMLESLMTARATGDTSASTQIYEHLRREFMQETTTKNLLPSFACTSRNLDVFWPVIKQLAGS